MRELHAARHAAGAGAPVIPPADELDPGPHRQAGRIVTFWRFVEPREELDARVAGRGLRTIHEAMLDFDYPLPPRAHPDEVVEMLASVESSADVELLREIAARRPELDGQALHGDGQALAAYGVHEADLLDALVPVYASWVYASMLAALPRRPKLAPLMRERLDWLRRSTKQRAG